MRPLRFDVDDDLYIWLKTQAAKEQKSMKELLVEALDALRNKREEENAS